MTSPIALASSGGHKNKATADPESNIVVIPQPHTDTTSWRNLSDRPLIVSYIANESRNRRSSSRSSSRVNGVIIIPPGSVVQTKSSDVSRWKARY